MARLIWTEPALAHLDEIAEYIALDDARAAARLVNKVFEGGERLERFPNSGKQPGELADTPNREVVVPPCRIFYRVDHELVYILYIMRSERLLHAWLLELCEQELQGWQRKVDDASKHLSHAQFLIPLAVSGRVCAVYPP